MRNNQTGIALLILLIVIVLAFITYTLSGVSLTQVRMSQTQNTLTALKEAKQAVINFSVTYSDRDPTNEYGLFPNPEIFFNGDYGNMSGVAGLRNLNTIGWFPWRSLDLEALKDESGTCLFYAISGTYKLGISMADMVNEDSIGMFQIVDDTEQPIKGANLEDRVIALVIAPGEPLAGQARNPLFINSNCGDDYNNVSAYLEGDDDTDNSDLSIVDDTVDNFIHATVTSKNEALPYNDKFLTITRDEVWSAIVKRKDFKDDMRALTRALAMCMAEYANHSDNTHRRLAWPTRINLGAITDYRVNANYDDDNATEGYVGRFPYVVNTSNLAIDPSGTNLIEPELFDIPAMCSSANLGVDWEGFDINLEDNSSKYGQLWNNWKDHMFYLVSQRYAPGNTGVRACGPGTCISMFPSNNQYAGAVAFSGSRRAGMTRNDRTDMSEYLEENKAFEFDQEFINRTGNRAYIYADPNATPDPANDIMYCINDNPIIIDDVGTLGVDETDLEVVECNG